MKKKILFSLILTVLLTCLFVVGVSAATIYKDANGTELFRYETFASTDEVTAYFGFEYKDAVGAIKSYTGSFPKTNAEGKELTWYATATATEGTDTVITVASGTTVGDVGTVSDAGVYSFNSGYKKENIVSANFPDNAGIKTLGFGSYGSYSSTFPKPSYNLLFIYCPNTLTEFGFNFIQSMPVIVCEIDDETPVTEIPQNFAHDARNLREINIPSSVVKINGNNNTQGAPFYRNVMLQKVTFASDENLTTMLNYCFSDCVSLTQFKVPNSVTEMGGQCFQNCKSLQKVWFGASLEKTLGYSVFRLCNNLKVYYISGTLTSVYQHTFTKDSGTSGPNDTVFFYAGTRAQFDVFYQSAVANKNNEKLTTGYKEDYIVEWDPTKEDSYYTNLATEEGHKLYVINYNVCQAFYDGEHTELGTPTYEYKGEEYLSNYVAISACSVCGITDSETVVCGPLFINKGYAKEENGSLFTYGIVIDKDEIAKYVAHTGKAFNYGMIVAAGDLVNDGALFDESAKAIDGTIIIDVTTTKYTVYQLKMTGIKDTQKDLSVYACAYVIDGTAVSYIGEETTDSAVAISYNQIKALITNNTTGNGEATENTDAA